VYDTEKEKLTSAEETFLSATLNTQISHEIDQDRPLACMMTDRRLNFRKMVWPSTWKLSTLKIISCLTENTGCFQYKNNSVNDV